MSEWFNENKKKVYLIGGIILILFTVLLMLRFWVITIVAIGSFAGGYIFARNQAKEKSKY